MASVPSISACRPSLQILSASYLFLILITLPSPCFAESFTVKVVAVLDGDTITVLRDDGEKTVRLNGVDAPEKGQAFGKRATRFTSERALNQTVHVDAKETDRDGRTIADVTLPDGTSLNRALVQEGLAWWFFKHSYDHTLRDLEQEARDAKRGLWRDPIPIPPWVFRKIQRKQVPDVPDFQYPGSITAVLGSTTGKTKIYRHPGCKSFHRMLKQKNATPLDTIEYARDQGFEPAPDCPEASGGRASPSQSHLLEPQDTDNLTPSSGSPSQLKDNPPVKDNPPASTLIIGNRKSRIYHTPDCPNYGQVSPKNEVRFKSRREAEAAGYRPAKNC